MKLSILIKSKFMRVCNEISHFNSLQLTLMGEFNWLQHSQYIHIDWTMHIDFNTKSHFDINKIYLIYLITWKFTWKFHKIISKSQNLYEKSKMVKAVYLWVLLLRHIYVVIIQFILLHFLDLETLSTHISIFVFIAFSAPSFFCCWRSNEYALWHQK